MYATFTERHCKPWKPCWKAVNEMANARLYGKKTAYTPNNKADMRYRKKLAKEQVSKATGRKKGNGGESCV